MKFKLAATLSGLSVSAWVAVAAPETPAPAKEPAKPVETLIEELSDEKFKVREEATRRLWEIGRPALSALEETAAGDDPERSYRARDLIHKIELNITPDTDPLVASLVERFAKAPLGEKVRIFEQLRRARAWRQMLKLYASETDEEAQMRLEQSISGVPVTAARECLAKGDTAGAREYLEMAPADAQNLLALADFHRSQGTLEAELKRAKTLKDDNAAEWQLALYRASGNLEAARDAATAAGETMISATMAALLGDPLPWLRNNESTSDGAGIHRLYSDLAIKRWQTGSLRASDLEPVEHALHSKNEQEQTIAMKTLALLGEVDRMEEGLRTDKASRMAFSYYDLLERVPEALKALGLDPAKPDYAAWVEKRVTALSAEQIEEEHEASGDLPELRLLAKFMEARGLHREAQRAYQKPLVGLAEKNQKAFLNFLTLLFGGSSMGEQTNGSPELAREIAVEWAGDRAERWDDIVDAAFGSQEDANSLWAWLAELDPKAGKAERFDGMLALCGMGRDPRRLRDKWLALMWDAIEKIPAEKRDPQLRLMDELCHLCPDVATSLKVWEMKTAKGDTSEHLPDLTATGRWQEAADVYLSLIESFQRSKQSPQPWLHACAAACLRKAGHAAEAAQHDVWVEKLALGNNALNIANAYAEGDDYQRAAEWWARAARQLEPGSSFFAAALALHGQRMLDEGRWKEAGAIAEVRAQFDTNADNTNVPMVAQLNLRLQADIGHGLAMLKTNREAAVAFLGNSFHMFPSDGSLADDFFPALRRAGLIKEHDEWFKISWDRMNAVLARYPGSDNTANTTAWLASRAQRKLDEAEALETRALDSNPDQSAYLDTMAEIQFAKGRREKALEWSTRAVNFSETTSGARGQIRQQHERFRSSPLPR